MVFALILSYTLFIGIQNAIISGLHPEFVALATLSFCFYFLEKRQWRWYWLFLLLTIGCKEDMVALTFALGIYLFLINFKKQAIATILLSLSYYLLTTKLLMPWLAHRPYGYEAAWPDLNYLLTGLFYPWKKAETLVISFITFGLLPFINIAFLPVIFQNYFIRFILNRGDLRWDLGMHYNAVVSVVLAYAAYLGVVYMQKKSWYKRFLNLHAGLIIFLVLYLHEVTYDGALGLFYNQAFYPHSQNFQFLENLLKKVPEGGLVMTLNNLAPHLTHTNPAIILHYEYWQYMPDTIALDLRDGQNINNFWPITSFDYQKYYERLTRDPNYRMEQVADDQVIFYKNQNLDMGWYDQFKTIDEEI